MNTGNGGKDCARFGVMISAFIDGELGEEERGSLTPISKSAQTAALI
jgi:hypothetical protein